MFESAKLVSWTFLQKPFNVLRTPESPLSRHSSIGFHSIKINWFAKQIDSKALLRPNQPNCLYQSNTSGLIKSCKLYNIAVTISVKCYPRMSLNNPLNGNWSLLCSASLHNKLPKKANFAHAIIPCKYNIGPICTLNLDSLQTISLWSKTV